MSSQFGIGQPLANDLRHCYVKALCIGQRPLVIAKSLLTHIPEQVKRFNGNIGSVNPALQEAPEVLHPVRMNVAVNAGFGVANKLVVKLVHPFVRQKRVGVYARSSFDVLANKLLKVRLAAGF